MHALFHLLCKSGHVWKRRCSSFLSLENVSTSNKYICFLLPSYYFFYLCIDINECNPTKELHRCSQTCINTEGSYNCSCTEGYELKKDGYECEGNCSNSAIYPYPDWTWFAVTTSANRFLASASYHLYLKLSLIKYQSFTVTALHFLLFLFFEFVIKSKDIPQLLFFFLSISFLLENVLKLWREIHLRSLLGAKGGLNYSIIPALRLTSSLRLSLTRVFRFTQLRSHINGSFIWIANNFITIFLPRYQWMSEWWLVQLHGWFPQVRQHSGLLQVWMWTRLVLHWWKMPR